MGLPTSMLRPTTTACCPWIGIRVLFEDRHDPLRRAGGKDRISGEEPPEVAGVKSIHILLGRDRIDDATGLHLRRQGELDQDAVDVGIVVEAADRLEHLFRGGVLRELDCDGPDPDSLTCPMFHADVEF